MIDWIAGLRPEWWEAVLAWLGIVAFWAVGPFLINWCSTQFQKHLDRTGSPSVEDVTK